jgi:type I restriction-modification system DNA methylase subunit
MATRIKPTTSPSASPEMPDVITKLVNRFNEQRDTYMSGVYNETQVRRDFIDPFFKALGWDIDNENDYAEAYRDVIHEDVVLVGDAKKAPDYSFRIGGTRKFFVEAKKPSVTISTDPRAAFQLRRYGWSAKLPLSILTDFEELAVYDCTHKPDEKHGASQARLYYFKYTEYATRWAEISGLFSKSAVMKGSFDRFANAKKRGTTTVDNDFLTEIEKWRQLLASNILQNNAISQRELNLAVQLIIDRIVFLRICEDRGIEDYERLLKIAKSNNVYQKLGTFFKDADDRYNSGLFHFNPKDKHATSADTITLNLKVDNLPLKIIIESLYLPNPYEFSFIPADILGQVYERFLGKVIQINGKKATIEEKPDVKKAGGVFYTPSYVVEYIVKNTVDKLLEGKTPKQAEKLRILDPACGSGSFLIVAYQSLLNWHLNYYVANGGPERFKKEVYSTGNGSFRLTTQIRKSVLLNSIYGVDIDAQAVEVTKLSLLLRVLEGENAETLGKTRTLFHERALPDLGNNIKCGNSLIGSDFYAQQNLPHLTDEDDYRINAFDWKDAFAEIFKDGGFDAIIGNPPWGANIDDFLEYYHHKYPSVTRQKTDSYKLFIGASLDLCKSGGLVGMIVPNTLLRQSRYQDARTEILKYGLQRVVDLGENVFDGAIVPSCVFTLSKKLSKKNDFLFLDASKLKDNLNKEKHLASPGWDVFMQSAQMAEHGLRSDDAKKAVSKIGECPFILLKDAGINYQRKNVGMSEKGKSDLAERLLYESEERHSRADRMYWKGRDIDRYYDRPPPSGPGYMLVH